MKSLYSLLAVASLAILSACASIPPTTSELAKVPVIEFGQPMPKDNNCIVHFPAGTPLPVGTVVDGNLFEHAGHGTLDVALKHDIYLYRRFVSLDGKHWVEGRKLIHTKMTVSIPSKSDKDAGLLHLQLDRKQ